MAQIINNEKGFKVIECSLIEIANLGGLGICDFCNKASFDGYYIAVLNCWYCPECYQDWIKRAQRYPEDAHVEQRNFERYSAYLGVSL